MDDVNEPELIQLRMSCIAYLTLSGFFTIHRVGEIHQIETAV